MRPRLAYSTDPKAVLKSAKSHGRNICWVLRHLLWGIPKSEQRKVLKDRVSAFREIYEIADYKALLAEAKRCGFFTRK